MKLVARLALLVLPVLLVICRVLPATEPRPLLTVQNVSGELAGWKSFHEGKDVKTGDVWTLGADGVLVCGCHLGDCHYQDGNYRTEKRAEAIKLMLEDFGLAAELPVQVGPLVDRHGAGPLDGGRNRFLRHGKMTGTQA